MGRRVARVNELIRSELSELLLRQIKDPRLGALVTITEVKVSPSLRHARVYVSVMTDPEGQARAMRALTSATGYFRRELKSRLRMHSIPELVFSQDNTLERGSELLALIDRVNPDRS